MIQRLLALLSRSPGCRTDGGGAADPVPPASAALLVEAALMDGHLDTRERETIVRLMGARFTMAPEACEAIIDEAVATVRASSQLYPFTRVVKDHWDEGQREHLMEMLWEVVYADGQLHDYEASLTRRIAGLIYVSDRASGAARQRVLGRLGVEGTG